jgi:tRNA(Arg) A34 adenosine deaminase TadA
MDETALQLLNEIEERVKGYIPDPEYPDDKFVLITLEEAIAASREGNFGVGAVLVDENGKIVQRGHNHVFHPHFRSDLHAEMYVMTEFEKRFQNVKSMEGLILYTSLEPCTMCFVRLISSGVGKVFYAAEDKEGGMVRRSEHIPPVWKELAQRQEFAKARCSPELSDMALRVFLSTAEENYNKLRER